MTIQNNQNNLVLLKEITDKSINDYEQLVAKEIPGLLDKVLVDKIKPFTQSNFVKQLIDLKEKNFSEPGTHYNTLNQILTQIQARVNENITELDRIKSTVQPFLTKDFNEIQTDNNAIFAIVFSNENSFKDLKSLSFELKNWDRGLFIYQQIISDETPKGFEIIEVDQGSIEVILNAIFEVGEKLLELFKTGFEVYGAYLVYKTIVYEKLVSTYRGDEKLLKSEEEREKLLLENVRKAVRDEIKKQAKKTKKHEALEKKIDEVTKLVTEHIIKGNNVKLLSAPKEKEDLYNKEDEKEQKYFENKSNFKKLDTETKNLLIEKFTTNPPEENYEKE